LFCERFQTRVIKRTNKENLPKYFYVRTLRELDYANITNVC